MTKKAPRDIGQDVDEQDIRSRHRLAASDGYLSLPLPVAYLWMSRRGLRRRFSQIVYYRPDGQIILKKSGFDTYMERFRVDPADVDEIVEKDPRPGRRSQPGDRHKTHKSSERKKSPIDRK